MAERDLSSLKTLSQGKGAPSSENTELFLIVENQGFLEPTKWRFVPCREFPVYIFFPIQL